MQHLEEEIAYIVNKIASGYHPEKIILFGSAAEDKWTSDSDLDFFIVKQDPRQAHLRMREVTALFEHRVATDVIVYTPEEVELSLKLGDPFVQNILRFGRIVYGG